MIQFNTWHLHSDCHADINKCFDTVGFWIRIRTNVTSKVVRYWRVYLSAPRCRWFAYGSTDATATSSSVAWLKSRLVSPFWCQFVVEKWSLNGCPSVVYFIILTLSSQLLCYLCLMFTHSPYVMTSQDIDVSLSAAFMYHFKSNACVSVGF